MPDIKHMLTDEIRRLAKKEIKQSLLPLNKAVSEQRKLIQELSRKLKELEKKNASFVSGTSAAPAPEGKENTEEDKSIRFSPVRITALREKLKMTKKAFAEIIGVTQFTIINWETGVSHPRENQKKRLAQIRSMGKREFKAMIEKDFPTLNLSRKPRKARQKAVKADASAAAQAAPAEKPAEPAVK